MENKEGLLSNIVIIRLVLVVLLVFFHSFAPFGGGWEPISGYPIVKAYWWLDWLSYSFMLESFVFISGNVFGYQVRTKGDNKLVFKTLFWGKFKRLIIPCIFFSFFYILCFKEFPHSSLLLCYDLLRGEGHMWFLPTLFWCFVFLWLIEKLKMPSLASFVLLFVCALCPFLPLPFQLGHTLYYMLFFYLGYILQRKNISFRIFESTKCIVCFCIAFLLLFPLLTLFNEHIASFIGGDTIFIPVLKHLAQIVYAILGLSSMWGIVNLIGKKDLSPSIIAISNMCMGVYIFQQFILKALYYHTTLPQVFSPYVLPWIGFVVALLGSLVLTYVLRKIKLGRVLLG